VKAPEAASVVWRGADSEAGYAALLALLFRPAQADAEGGRAA
jgi:hypothetical protein